MKAVSILEVVQQTAKQHQLWKRNDTIVVAVSGGVDSMVLLYMLHKCAQKEELNLVVAHVNHGYRKEESANEKLLVEGCAKKLGLPFEYIELDMPQYLLSHVGNGQDLARKRRYRFLYDVAARYRAHSIATAHHADDQVETVLQHFIRGSGLAGLSGMAFKRSEKNVQLIRPLLRSNKDSIYQYQKENGIPYLEDSSNLKTDYTRNQLRLNVIPYLEQYNRNFKQATLRLAELVSDEDDFMEQLAEKQLAELATLEEKSVKINRQKLSKLHVALQRRVIKLILNYLSSSTSNLTYESIERVREAIYTTSTTSRSNISGNIWCILEYDIMRFIREEDVEYYSDEQQQIVIPYESTQLSFGHWDISVTISPQQEALTDRFTAIFDADELIFPLIIRTRQPGDRMQVQGLSGTKKLQDLFVDAKIPSIHRLQYPIICDQERLIWVPGIRRSQAALVTDKTKVFVMIQVLQR